MIRIGRRTKFHHVTCSTKLSEKETVVAVRDREIKSGSDCVINLLHVYRWATVDRWRRRCVLIQVGHVSGASVGG